MSNVVWTDGSNSTKTGAMGWAVVGEVNGERVRKCGWGGGSNQVAELTAVLNAMLLVPTAGKIHIVTDSMYAIGVNESWRENWQRNGYTNYGGNRISNYDLVRQCHEVYEARDVTFEHVRGHKGVEGNELADALCGLARLVGEGRDDLAGLLADYLEGV